MKGCEQRCLYIKHDDDGEKTSLIFFKQTLGSTKNVKILFALKKYNKFGEPLSITDNNLRENSTRSPHVRKQYKIQKDLDSVSLYSSKNHLVPHPTKTIVIIFSKPPQATKFKDRAVLSLNNAKTEYVNSYKCLGFSLEQYLDYFLHVKDTCKKINYGLQTIRRVKPFVSESSLILLANLLVLSHLDYCSPVLYNLSTCQIETLLKLQKQCAHLIYSCNRI